jgi:hypothetical protein
VILLLATGIVIGLISLVSIHLSKKPKPIESRLSMSVFNQGSSGAMALREFFERMGISTGTIMRTTDRFMSEVGEKKAVGALMFLEPESPLEKKEILHLNDLAKSGISIIVLTSAEEKIAGIMHTISADRFPKIHSGMYLTDVKNATAAVSLSHGMGKLFLLELPAKKRFRTYHADWEIVARDAQGVFVVSKKIGPGKIILASDSAFASNVTIRKSDNGLFIYRLISSQSTGKTVFFDEYHHGYSRRFTLLYFIARKDYAFFLAHALALFFLLLVGSFVRFGRTHTSQEEEDNNIFFFTKGMASLLSKKRFALDLATILANTITAAPSNRANDKHTQRFLSETILSKINKKDISFKDIKNITEMLRRKQHGNQRIRRED